MENPRSKHHGFILILAVIIISAVLSVILINASLSALTNLNNNSLSLQGAGAKFLADGCANEALLRLNRDKNYAGGSFNIDTGACLVIVSGTENTRSLAITGSLNNFSTNLTIAVTLDPFAVTSWDN